MSKTVDQETSNQLILLAEDSPVRTYPWPEDVRDLMENDQDFGSNSIAFLQKLIRAGSSSKTFPACYPAMKAATLPSSFEGWRTSGMVLPTGYWTLNTSEWPNAAAVCSLSEVLETEVQPKYFGVAQRRRRVFIIGSLGNGSAAEILFESESLQRHSAPSRKAGKVAPAIPASGAGTSRTGNARTEVDMMVAAPVTARQGKGGFTDPANDGVIAATLNMSGKRGFRTEPGEHLVASPLKSGGNSRHDESHETFIASPLRSRSSPNSNIPRRGGEDDENIVIGFTPGNSADSYGIGEDEEISPPVRGGGAGAKPTIAFAQNTRDEVREMGDNKVGALANQPGMKQQTFLSGEMGVRRLTPTECERLQGFPDGWTEGFADTVRYRMLGNAVCVPVAEWIGKRILEHENP